MERSLPEQGWIEFGAPPEELLTVRQVAKRLNVSISWVQDHASGRCLPILPSYKFGHALQFKPSEVDEFVEHCKRAIARGIPVQ